MGEIKQALLEFNREEYEEATCNLKEWNPASKYEEKTYINGLSLYDVFRRPRAVLPADAPKSLNRGDLDAELQCLICFGVFRKTMVVMECLHRFCHDCIVDALRLGKKECPKCRLPVATKRNLRPDATFDALIQTIYPNLDAFESAQDAQIAADNKKRNFNNAFTESCRLKQQHQKKSRSNNYNNNNNTASKASSVTTTTTTKTSSSSSSSVSTNQTKTATLSNNSTKATTSSSSTSNTKTSTSAKVKPSSPKRLMTVGKDVEFHFKPNPLSANPLPGHFPPELAKKHRISVIATINHLRKHVHGRINNSIASSSSAGSTLDSKQIQFALPIKDKNKIDVQMPLTETMTFRDIFEKSANQKNVIIYFHVEPK